MRLRVFCRVNWTWELGGPRSGCGGVARLACCWFEVRDTFTGIFVTRCVHYGCLLVGIVACKFCVLEHLIFASAPVAWVRSRSRGGCVSFRCFSMLILKQVLCCFSHAAQPLAHVQCWLCALSASPRATEKNHSVVASLPLPCAFAHPSVRYGALDSSDWWSCRSSSQGLLNRIPDPIVRASGEVLDDLCPSSSTR